MELLLYDLGFFNEEIEKLKKDLLRYNEGKVCKVIKLLYKYNCHIDFIKEIVLYHHKIFEIEVDRLEYLFEAIISNNDVIEDTLLEII